MEIQAKNALFINLGRKGKYQKDCIENSNTIQLGFKDTPHSACLKGEWEEVEKYWNRHKKNKGKATETVRQIKDFYESPEDTIWITFHNRKLFWCFAERKVYLHKDRSRFRKVKGKWSSKDINGNILYIEKLSGNFTKVQRFQGTICRVKEFDYLLNKLNNKRLPEIQEAEIALDELKYKLKPLIQKLTYKDFELLADLIFTSSGWKRISTVGKTEKYIDMVLFSPVNNKKAFVQVKSASKLDEYKKYKKDFIEMKQYDEMYYVVHTPDDKLDHILETNKNIKVITLNKITELTINSGLINWLIEKCA